MDDTCHILNELLVDLFNYILLIGEKNLCDQGVELSVTRVHILEAIGKSESSMIPATVERLMVTQGTLTVLASKFVKRGYVECIKDERDERIVRLKLTEKAVSILDIHNHFHEEVTERLSNELELDKEVELIQSLRDLMEFFKGKHQSLFLSAGFFCMQAGEWCYNRNKRYKKEWMLQARESSSIMWYQSESMKDYEG